MHIRTTLNSRRASAKPSAPRAFGVKGVPLGEGEEGHRERPYAHRARLAVDGVDAHAVLREVTLGTWLQIIMQYLICTNPIN